MNARISKRLFSRVSAGGLIGRDAEVERLYLRGVSSAESRPLSVVGRAGAGTSELLRSVSDRLFFKQRFVIPFYFSLNASDADSYSAAVRFKYQFLLQAIAFRTNDAELLDSAPDVCELAKLAPLNDSGWVDRLCDVCKNDGPLNDERSFVRTALSAPLRAAAEGMFSVCIIVDDLHEAAMIENGRRFVDELLSVANQTSASFLFGYRKAFKISAINFETFEIRPLDRNSIGRLIDDQANELGIVSLSEQARDLIAVQFANAPRLAKVFLQAARSNGRPLESYRDVAQLYSRELTDGVFKAEFEQLFARPTKNVSVRRKLVDSLSSAGNEEFDLDLLEKRLGIDRTEFDRLVEQLEIDEILVVRSGVARVAEDALLRDYLATHRRSDARQTGRGAIAALAVTNTLKRSPRMMSRVYRDEASIGLTDLLLSFDIQSVPRAMLDYGRFRERLKGMPQDEITTALNAETEMMTLPQIAHAASIVDHLPDFDANVEPNRAVLGVGFTGRGYRDEDEVAWFAAEIDSKLEADAAITHEWCDRLDQAANELGYTNHRIWLVAPEGFSDGAIAVLSDHNGIGSSRRQGELFKEFLTGRVAEQQRLVEEYEIVIPIGDDTELISAHALEDIARKHSFPAKAVNQIKTALVEACINAAEHSLSPDRKIYQKFAVDDEKVTISISNRGLRLTDRFVSAEADPKDEEGRRGWGLGLIRTLMDEVSVESVDDGTRIVMTKFIKPKS